MKPIAVIPNMITLGNAVCGFAAIVKAAHGEFLPAAWLILLAMVFDAFDGKIARLTKQTSAFGAQLDSLSDCISFGIAPAVIVALILGPTPDKEILPKAVWFFSVVFALAVVLRLARFNVAEAKGDEDHEIFQGLPSPAAAGLVASLVIFKYYLAEGVGMEELGRKLIGEEVGAQLGRFIIFPILPASTLLLGYLMISSRIRYSHVVSRYLSGKRTWDYFAYLVFIVFLAAAMREVALVLGFGLYAASGPVAYALGRRGSLEEADHEAEELPGQPAPADIPDSSPRDS